MELKDTVKLMNSNDYRERFKAEYLQTKIRHDKLDEMLIKYNAGTLGFTPSCNIGLLDDQLWYMERYLRILQIRAETENIDLEGV